jgi:DNA topoisomerase IB
MDAASLIAWRIVDRVPSWHVLALVESEVKAHVRHTKNGVVEVHQYTDKRRRAERPMPKGRHRGAHPSAAARRHGDLAPASPEAAPHAPGTGATAPADPLAAERHAYAQSLGVPPALMREDGKTIFGHGIPAGMTPAPQNHAAMKKFGPAYHVLIPTEGERDGMIAIGIDRKGRTKREYSDAFKEGQARAKYQRVRGLMGRISDVDDHLRSGGTPPPPEDDNDAALLLIRATGMRPGSESNTGADTQAFGATTLRAEHVITGPDGSVRLQFVGKGGKNVDIPVADPAAAAMLTHRASQDKPGDQLFPKANEKSINTRFKQIAGDSFKPKDMRTLLATAMAHDAVRRAPEPKSPKEAVALRNQIADEVAAQLGNTRAMALGSYIAPDVWGGWPLPKTKTPKAAAA